MKRFRLNPFIKPSVVTGDQFTALMFSVCAHGVQLHRAVLYRIHNSHTAQLYSRYCVLYIYSSKFQTPISEVDNDISSMYHTGVHVCTVGAFVFVH